MKAANFNSPFLKTISWNPGPANQGGYPFTIPKFSREFTLELSRPISFFVGENGGGKSTLLEGLAGKIGFNMRGGNRDHASADAPAEDTPLMAALRLSWLPKVNTGFFMRAESFFNFASYIDDVSGGNPKLLRSYGGKPLNTQSHGESFPALFANKFRERGVYLLDEPEAALSPLRQLGFLSVLHHLEKTGLAQFIIASHSPILLSYPGAEILSFDEEEIKPMSYAETEHYKVTKAFLNSPESHLKHLFSEPLL